MICVSHSGFSSARLPAAFSGFRIVHISDLHSARFGEGQRLLLDAVCAARPDLVAITGDIVDRRRFDLAPALEFVRGALALAPVCYVPGNHEALSGKSGEIRTALAQHGVCTLFDEDMELSRGGDFIRVLGLRDPAFYEKGAAPEAMRRLLSAWTSKGGFTLLLSHRPELFALYRACGVDLALCGHAHGGQIRLPLVGGVFAPHQGFFPKYTNGLYREGGCAMVVSRGLGESLFPVRVRNAPEVVVVTLDHFDDRQ